MSEWREFRLDEVADIVDCEHKTAPIVENSEFYSIRTSNISNGKIDFHSSNRVSFETYQEWTKRATPKEGDIILAREAPVGEVGIVKKGYKACLGQRTVLLSVNNEKVNNQYLLYYLVNPVIKFELTSRSTGSVVSHLNMKDIRAFEISLPSFREQKAIAGVLSSLDDKIDLLHRQNKTLEQMAEALFRQWFIEEAGEDWEKTDLLDVISLIGGGTPKTSQLEYWEGEIFWLSGGDIASSHKSFAMSSEKKITQEGLNNSSAKLLPKFSTIISARGTVGKYALLSKPMTYSQSNYGIIPKIDNCFFFTYLLINHLVNELQSSAYGSVFDTITTTTFKDIIISIPSDNQIKDFEKNVSVYFLKKLNCLKQIQTLEKLRDNLLPKLMSGEVRVKW